MLKDLRLSQQAAAAVDAATPLGAHAAALYAAFVADGGRGRDFSAMLPGSRRAARRRLRRSVHPIRPPPVLRPPRGLLAQMRAPSMNAMVIDIERFCRAR